MPALRAADPDTLVVADGFSCRTQISHLEDGSRPLHTAQVLAAPLRARASGASPDPGTRTHRTAVAGVAIVAAGLWALSRRSRS